MRCTPDQIIRLSPLKERIRYKDGNTMDIVSVILDMDKVSDQYINPEAAKCLIGIDDYETLRNVWAFVKDNISYRADKSGREVVKSPNALFALRKGDCKSFSIAVVALIRALGFKGIRYRFTSYKATAEISHVYVVCKIGSREVVIDSVWDYFDDEPAYSYKKDIKANVNYSGIGKPSTQVPQSNKNRTLFNLLAFGFAAWALTR